MAFRWQRTVCAARIRLGDGRRETCSTSASTSRPRHGRSPPSRAGWAARSTGGRRRVPAPTSTRVLPRPRSRTLISTAARAVPGAELYRRVVNVGSPRSASPGDRGTRLDPGQAGARTPDAELQMAAFAAELACWGRGRGQRPGWSRRCARSRTGSGAGGRSGRSPTRTSSRVDWMPQALCASGGVERAARGGLGVEAVALARGARGSQPLGVARDSLDALGRASRVYTPEWTPRDEETEDHELRIAVPLARGPTRARTPGPLRRVALRSIEESALSGRPEPLVSAAARDRQAS